MGLAAQWSPAAPMVQHTSPMRMAYTKEDRLAALDSARAVPMAAHAADGLAAHVGAGHVARALRVAEAMGRSAHPQLVAHFGAATHSPPRAPAGATGTITDAEAGDNKRQRIYEEGQGRQAQGLARGRLWQRGHGQGQRRSSLGSRRRFISADGRCSVARWPSARDRRRVGRRAPPRWRSASSSAAAAATARVAHVARAFTTACRCS